MEIERKFLVKNDSWKMQILSSKKITQFYLTDQNQFPSVRLRIAGEEGFLTVKYPSISSDILARDEFEYAIPIADINEQLEHATGSIIKKTRNIVPGPDKKLWEIDVFDNPPDMPPIAEIELNSVDACFSLPDWLGKEVTSDKKYSNLEMSFRS